MNINTSSVSNPVALPDVQSNLAAAGQQNAPASNSAANAATTTPNGTSANIRDLLPTAEPGVTLQLMQRPAGNAPQLSQATTGGSGTKVEQQSPVTVKTQALQIDKDGLIVNQRVVNERRPAIEYGSLSSVKGIIVHQTDGPTAKSSLDSYKNKGANGAHFLIDKDGTIYQTASLNKQTAHVGKLKSRCAFEQKCPEPKYNPAKTHQTEKQKTVPDRFPSNDDSIGIELVGQAFPRGDNIQDNKKTYETVTDAQNDALSWLIDGLSATLKIPRTEIFRHPVVSHKNLTEASTAKF
jgi:hypothetical protein